MERKASPGSPGLVGRASELAAIEEALDALSRGTGRLLLFAGGPGLGKSRLALEAVALARCREVLTAWGRCRETAGAPAFWPWAQVLRTIRAEAGAALEEAGGSGAASLAQVMPDGGERGEIVDPFQIYDAMARALARVAAARPLLVVLDDLHAADPGSLRALQFVAAELESSPLVLVGTYRDEEAGEDQLLTRVVAELATSASTRLAFLDGLDGAGVASLIASVTGAPVGPDTAEAVRERTGGNPFFVTELARLGLDGAVPLGVREVIRARLRRLPEPTRVVLAAASVLGRDFGGELLESVSELRGVPLVAALQPAAQARLISPDPERQGRYRFVHALVQEVLYSDLPAPLLRAAHERATRALDALPRTDRDLRIDELAFHACAAVDDRASRARAAALCEAAARRAEAGLAYDDAARWLERSLAIRPDRPPPELLFARADALARTPEGAGARQCYEAAFEDARRAGDGAAMARAALGVGEVVVSAGLVDQPLVRMLVEAERLVPADEPVSIRLEARRAIELYWHLDREPARRAAAHALARADRAGDQKAVGAALHARRFVLRGPDHLGERILLGERLARLAVETRDDDLELSAHAWLLPEYLSAGDLAAADEALSALDRLVDQVKRPIARWHQLLFRALRAVFSGRFVEALATIERARVLGRRVGSQPADLFAAAQRAVVLRDLGRFGESIGELRELAATYPILVTLQCELAMLLADAGEGAEACELLDRVGHGGFRTVPRDSLWRASIALAGQAAATLGQVGHARTAAVLLRPYTGLNVVQGVPVAWGATDHYLGVAAAACGDLDAAIAHLDEATRLHTAWGAAAFRAASLAELANVLHKRGRAEDRRRVLGLEAAAHAEATRLGIVRPLLVRQRRTHPEGPGAGSRPLGLTEREAQILKLLAAGEANKEIAQALRISVHTVERHLANIYAKMGARNRADAAAFAVARGLSA